MLGLGTEARMNLPGTEQGNWQWRYAPDADERARGAAARAYRVIASSAFRMNC